MRVWHPLMRIKEIYYVAKHECLLNTMNTIFIIFSQKTCLVMEIVLAILNQRIINNTYAMRGALNINTIYGTPSFFTLYIISVHVESA